jgi:hypothetical protein
VAGVFDDMARAPYTYQTLESESINLTTGSLLYESEDYYLPGVNGLDLRIVTRYDSGRADFYKYHGSSNLTSYTWVNVYAVFMTSYQWLEQNGAVIPN